MNVLNEKMITHQTHCIIWHIKGLVDVYPVINGDKKKKYFKKILLIYSENKCISSAKIICSSTFWNR